MRSPRRRRGAAALAGLLIAVAGSLYADYKSDFVEGMKMLDRKRHAEAADYFRRALAEKPLDDGERIRVYGSIPDWYLPNFYLGVALQEMGDCRAALRAFEASEAGGKIGELRRKQLELEKARGECQQVLAAAGTPSPDGSTGQPSGAAADPSPGDSAPDRAPAGPDPAVLAELQKAAVAIEQAEAAKRELDRYRSQPQVAAHYERDRPLRRRYDAAELALGSAKQTIAERESATTADAEKAQSTARVAARSFNAVHASLADLVKQAAAETDLPVLQEEVTEPTEVATTDLPRDSEPEAEEPPSTEPSGDRTAAGDGPPPALRAAARALFAADYRKVRAALEGLSGGDRRSDVTIRLLRAAASFGLWAEGGESDDALLDAARSDAAACARLAPDLRPDRRFFSPRFLRFYVQSRG